MVLQSISRIWVFPSMCPHPSHKYEDLHGECRTLQMESSAAGRGLATTGLDTHHNKTTKQSCLGVDTVSELSCLEAKVTSFSAA